MREAGPLRFGELTLGWLVRASLLIVVVGAPTGLAFAVHALVDSWGWTIVIIVVLAGCLASLLFGEHADCWTPDGE